MKRKKGSSFDENMPVGKLTPVKNFLPPPHELAKARRIVRVTIELDLSSINFFKRQAQKHKTKYQRMIREVLSKYASGYDKAA